MRKDEWMSGLMDCVLCFVIRDFKIVNFNELWYFIIGNSMSWVERSDNDNADRCGLE